MAGKKKRNQKSKRLGNGGMAGGVVGLTSTPSIFPPMFRGKQIYNTVLSFAPPAGGVAANVFRLNSVYDPDLSGVGVSASCYSQLTALYGRYRVLAARSTVEFVNISTTTPLTVFMTANPVTTVGVNIAQILSQRFVWTAGLSTTNGTGSVKHTIAAPVWKLYGVPEQQVRNEDDFAAVAGTNPNNGVFLHVGAYANGATGGNFNAHIRIEYDVVWSLPLEMS